VDSALPPCETSGWGPAASATVAGMPEVRVVSVAPQSFAGVRRAVQQPNVTRELMASLDTVWSVIRARGLDRRGRMVAVYRKLDGGTIGMECGVEVFGPFAPEGEVQLLTTPGGVAAYATHVGSVQRIGETYRLIDEWLQGRGTSPLGVSWEIYGHADEITGAFDIELFVLLPPGAETPASL